jgi:hypothetical protein
MTQAEHKSDTFEREGSCGSGASDSQVTRGLTKTAVKVTHTNTQKKNNTTHTYTHT